jgi:hypothetical protein
MHGKVRHARIRTYSTSNMLQRGYRTADVILALHPLSGRCGPPHWKAQRNLRFAASTGKDYVANRPVKSRNK